MGECVGVFQGMGDEVAVFAVVVLDAAVSVVFAGRLQIEQKSVNIVWVDVRMGV